MNRDSPHIITVAFLLFIMPILAALTGCSARGKLSPVSLPVETTTPKASTLPSEKIPHTRQTSVPATQRPYSIEGKTYYPLPSAEGYSETGIASWYGIPFHGRKTSNGEIYNMYDWTAAHKTLPMNTKLLVESLENGRSTTVRINDRGPFVGGRVIDLSYNVARELGLIREGTARVRITALGEAETIQTASGQSETRFLPHADFQQGDFFVQVGAFSVKENADRLRDRLNKEGREAETFRHERGDQVFYRVQIRAGKDLSVARQLERTMAEAGFAGAFVIAR